MQVVIGDAVGGGCRTLFLNSGAALVDHKDIGVQAAGAQGYEHLIRRTFEVDGAFLAEFLDFVAGGQQVDAALHLDGQFELQGMSVLGGVDSHDDDGVALDVVFE